MTPNERDVMEEIEQKFLDMCEKAKGIEWDGTKDKITPAAVAMLDALDEYTRHAEPDGFTLSEAVSLFASVMAQGIDEVFDAAKDSDTVTRLSVMVAMAYRHLGERLEEIVTEHGERVGT